MSNLTSKFEVLSGRGPVGRSAMEGKFPQKVGETPELTEGMVAKIEADASDKAVATKLTSANTTGSIILPDYPWLVIQGADQSDAAFGKNLTFLALKTGVIWRVEVAVPGNFAVGDLVYSNAGVPTVVAAAQQAIGQVIRVNVAGSYIEIASGGE